MPVSCSTTRPTSGSSGLVNGESPRSSTTGSVHRSDNSRSSQPVTSEARSSCSATKAGDGLAAGSSWAATGESVAVRSRITNDRGRATDRRCITHLSRVDTPFDHGRRRPTRRDDHGASAARIIVGARRMCVVPMVTVLPDRHAAAVLEREGPGQQVAVLVLAGVLVADGDHERLYGRQGRGVGAVLDAAGVHLDDEPVIRSVGGRRRSHAIHSWLRRAPPSGGVLSSKSSRRRQPRRRFDALVGAELIEEEAAAEALGAVVAAEEIEKGA